MIKISDLMWLSDCNGEEVGYSDINVIGLYNSSNLGCTFYINTETGEIVEINIDDNQDI